MIGQNDRQSDFALGKIFADIFPEHAIYTAIIERVIDQLKSDAEIAAIGGSAFCSAFAHRQ